MRNTMKRKAYMKFESEARKKFYHFYEILSCDRVINEDEVFDFFGIKFYVTSSNNYLKPTGSGALESALERIKLNVLKTHKVTEIKKDNFKDFINE